ncbi:MAG TPA: ATP-binding protein [Saprospiraceae bacterium]|nr:ATP-binding protein [Saprospiraceae bacterium]
MKITAQLGAFFDTSRTFFATAVNLEGNYSYINRFFQEEFDFITSNFIGMPFQIAIHPDDIDKCVQAVNECYYNPLKNASLILRKPMSNGDYHWTHWEFSAITEENDQVTGIFCIGYNITDLEHNRRNIGRYARFQQIVMELATDFVNTPLNAIDTSIQQMLQRVGVFVGADRAYVFEYDFQRQVTSNTHEWCAEGIEPAIHLLQRVPLSDFEHYAYLHRKGKIIHVPRSWVLRPDDPMRQLLEIQHIKSMISLPMMYEDTCIGFVGLDAVNIERIWTPDEIAILRVLAELLTNVRLRQKQEQQLLTLNVGLEQRIRERTADLTMLNEELEAFSYSVSHDLKTPLRHISSFVDLIRRRLEPIADPELAQYMQYVLSATNNMGLIIEELLHFSKVSQQTLKKKPTNQATIVQDILQDFDADISSRNVVIHVQAMPKTVIADPFMMKLLWQNLLSNALKYTRPRAQAKVTIGHYIQNKYHVFFVQDNGVGFDMQLYERLFSPFQRLHAREQFEGTGIGLATVKRIVQKHEGAVWAEAKSDEGATFYFSLPER